MNHHPVCLLLAAALVAIVAPGVDSLTVEDCPQNLARDTYLHVFGNYCYEFVMYKSVEFDEAEAECVKKSGHLVKIPNILVQNFIQGKLRSDYMTTTAVWIGLTDHNSDNVWEWVVDGTEPKDYDNWAPGQPGTLHNLGLEECAAMEPTQNGQWHDYRCTHLLFLDFGHPYICQYGPFGNSSQTTQPMPKTTMPPTTMPKSSMAPTTMPKSTMQPTTMPQTTMPPTTMPKSTMQPTTMPKSSMAPTTMPKTTGAQKPTTMAPTTPPSL